MKEPIEDKDKATPIGARPIGKDEENWEALSEAVKAVFTPKDKDAKEFIKMVSMKQNKVRTAMDRLNGMEVRNGS